MAHINRKRLHLLIAALCAGIAAFYGTSLWRSEYPRFANGYIRDRQVQAIERQSGTSYFEWEKDQATHCSKWAEDPKNIGGGLLGLYPAEQKERLYRMCMSPALVVVDDSEVIGAFLARNAHWIVAYILASLAVAWLAGFTIAKALPKGAAGFWKWLTTDEKSQ